MVFLGFDVFAGMTNDLVVNLIDRTTTFTTSYVICPPMTVATDSRMQEN